MSTLALASDDEAGRDDQVSMKVVLLGDSCTGKTAICCRFAQFAYPQKYSQARTDILKTDIRERTFGRRTLGKGHLGDGLFGDGHLGKDIWETDIWERTFGRRTLGKGHLGDGHFGDGQDIVAFFADFRRGLLLTSDHNASQSDGASSGVSELFLKCRLSDHRSASKFQLWDVGGHNLTSPTMLNTYIFGAQAVLFVYDVTNTQSFDNLTDWVAAAKKSRAQMEKPFCMGMIGNKTDSEHRRAVSVDRHNKFAEQNAFSAHFVAAKTGDSIELMFRKTAAEVLGIQLTIADEELNVSVVKAQITPVDGGSQNRRKQKRGGREANGAETKTGIGSDKTKNSSACILQ